MFVHVKYAYIIKSYLSINKLLIKNLKSHLHSMINYSIFKISTMINTFKDCDWIK